MSDDLVLPVAELIEATYVVPLAGPLPEGDPVPLLRRLLPGRWEDPDLGARLEFVFADSMPAQVLPASALSPMPMELFEEQGATRTQVARLQAATHIFLSQGRGRPSDPPMHEWATRALAVLMAEHVGSDVIDVLDIRICTPAKARLALPKADGEITIAEWVSVSYSAGSAGYWVTTTGLRRFGLPELQTLAVPPGVVELWGRTLTGVALRLVELWQEVLRRERGEPFVPFPREVSFTAADVDRAYDRPADEFGAVSATVSLTLDPGNSVAAGHPFLTVNPPLSWRGSAGEFLTSTCAQLYGSPRQQVRHTHRTPAMDRAIETARAGLDDIRSRFESGELGLHTKLLVKYRLQSAEGGELLWAHVTSWRDPDRVLATSDNDAIYHPLVRRGKPIVVDSATIIDWAVEHDEQGLIEGAFTQTLP